MNNNGNGQLVPAVAYYRRSDDDKQKMSITGQRTKVEEYAVKNGYTILREYVDDGISGDDTDKRLDFLRMHADAQEKGDFRAVLVWMQDRYGRFPPDEAIHWTFILAKAGVQLVTLDKGPIERAEWMQYGMDQHGKHEFLKDLSGNVLRGQVEAAKQGSWIGSVPRGYLIVGPKYEKRLVLGNPADVELVKRIFREYVEEGRSLNEIAGRLNADGIIATKGGRWRYDAVRAILSNPAYIGTFRFNVNSRAKYTHYKGGELVKGSGSGLNDEADWIVRHDNHEPIIDRATFDRAQPILAKGKTGRSKYTSETNPYIFTGLLRCGKCGAPMWGFVGRGKRRYECSKKVDGRDSPCTSVSESDLLRFIADYLAYTFQSLDGNRKDRVSKKAERKELQPGDLPKAFAKIKALIAPPSRPANDRHRLEKQQKTLVADLKKARDNLVLLDAGNIPAAQEKIKRMQTALDQVEMELRQKPPTEDDINAEVLQVLRTLYWWWLYFDNAANPKDPETTEGWVLSGDFSDALKPFLRHIDKIVVRTIKSGSGQATRHVFDSGELWLPRVVVITSKSNLHEQLQRLPAYH
jgi:site-specific DNA recombinase